MSVADATRHKPLMIFAAGRGTRMGPLGQDRPKPLIPVAGRCLIDHALAQARGFGTAPIVVNLHHRAEAIRAHLADQPDLILSAEETLLETGGGLRAALQHLGPGPVMTLSTDLLWHAGNPLAQLEAAWDPRRMDALLLLVPMDRAPGHEAEPGDFARAPDGRLVRGRGHLYAGAQIVTTPLLHEIDMPVFSLNRLWDLMIARGRLYGLEYRGFWADAGTAALLPLAESAYRAAADV